MDLSKLTLFKIMNGRMKHLGARQSVIAENIANANTPNYKAKDIQGQSFQEMVASSGAKVPMKTTNAGHISTGSSGAASMQGIVKSQNTYETSPDGNNVVLEEQLLKQMEVAKSYKHVTSIYKKHLGMIRMAIKGSGGG